MADDVQLDEPAAELLRVAADVVPGWLLRLTTGTCDRAAVRLDRADRDLVDRMVDDTTSSLLVALRGLLASDVDEQRTTPLSLFRAAVAAPTALLEQLGATRPPPDPLDGNRFPDDPFGLGPATWSDVDPALHRPGLVWGASKAMIVLTRRRDAGLR
jgi:hypothetical protein